MLPLFVLMLCLNAVLSAMTSEPTLDQHWEQWKNASLDQHWQLWKKHYNKTYNQREEGWRRTVWEKNLRKIELHNLEHSLGKLSFTLGMNHFGDLTNEEFRQMMNGYKPRAEKVKSFFTKPNFLNVPSSVDWRESGYVTPVKDQGQCGSCWAFSATGAMEGQLYRNTSTLVPLSEQNLMDCSGPEGNNGCNGGWMNNAFRYVIDNRGLDSESSYPYKGENMPCSYDPSYSAINLIRYVNVVSGSEESLMEAVGFVGPVSVAIDASHTSFQFYHSGIYHEPDCSETLDHAVLVVGYGTTQNLPSEENYWIVKNSWSSNWGDDGYIYMSKDNGNNCGIANEASFPEI